MNTLRVSLFRLAFAVAFFSLLMGANGAVEAGSPYIGMQPQELPRKAAAAMGFEDSDGIVAIRDVGRNTPASRAGVKRGDILISINGEKINRLAQVVAIVTKGLEGEDFEMTVHRDGKEIDLTLTSDKWPEQRKIKKTLIGQIPALGLTTGALTQKIRTQFGIRWDSEGVVVTLVDPSKGISEVVKRGDVIVQFNQQPVWLPDQLIDAYGAAKEAKKDVALLLLERAEGYVFITLPVR